MLWKYYCQISSDLVVPIARYGNLNWRVKKRGFQAANREYYIAKCVYAIVAYIPVDYKVWSVLQERVYRSQIRDVEHLKVRLVEEWRLFSQNIVDAAVKQWRVRLRACVKADGGHFEHQL